MSPAQVVSKLEKLAGKKTDKARISGCEPVLGRVSAQHLADIISSSKLEFVVETNAVCLGAYPELFDLFESLDNYRFRVSLKATNGLDWEKFTGANVWGYVYQQKAIKELLSRHIKHSIAFMTNFVDYNKIDYQNTYALEDENLRYYPGTKRACKHVGSFNRSFYLSSTYVPPKIPNFFRIFVRADSFTT